MKLSECYWCTLSHAISDEAICCNEKSENYNKPFSKQERDIRGCENGETKQAVDYQNMTAWEIASRYYM